MFKSTLGVLLKSLLYEEKRITDPLEDAKNNFLEVKNLKDDEVNRSTIEMLPLHQNFGKRDGNRQRKM